MFTVFIINADQFDLILPCTMPLDQIHRHRSNSKKDKHKQNSDRDKEMTDQMVKARNRLAGPPSARSWPIWTYNIVPIVPPIPVTYPVSLDPQIMLSIAVQI